MTPPAGLVRAQASVTAGRVRSVRFTNVPSFVAEPEVRVDVPGVGSVRCAIAFGGAFYAYVDADEVGFSLVPAQYRRIIEVGQAVKAAVVARGQPVHPGSHAGAEPASTADPDVHDLDFLYGTIFVGPPEDDRNHSRNVCVFADGEVDRSPTGTGVSGRLALHHAAGDIDVGQEIVIESILGTTFSCRVSGLTEVGGVPAVIPEVTGSAHLTGRSEWWLDPADPLVEGFFLR